MARTLYCRLCFAPFESLAGEVPTYCQSCKCAGHWTTMKPAAPAPDAADPIRPEEPNAVDKIWMRRHGLAWDVQETP